MKWLGVLILISTSTWIGFEWSKKINQRPAHIRQLKNALQILEAEMLYSQLPLQSAFNLIAKRIAEPAKLFFQQLSEAMKHEVYDFTKMWEEQLRDYLQNSSLGANESEILQQFGRTLGQHDFMQQQKQIRLAIAHLDQELESARDFQLRYGSMSKVLGFLIGLFFTILLI
ncbi:stage III sporulation protein SpoIIIAB [Ornithinibacillus sp. 4-3]|uniref:Stage III sporulation protein SpoIIIAB n=1 Tax=Ornithinibacillus sp. 4-3 TaxID=3231488 RepID=A0AB39HL02_9BACI